MDGDTRRWSVLGLTRSCAPEVGRQAAGYNDAAPRARPAILACGAVRYGRVGPPCVAVLRAGVRRPRRVVVRVQAGLAWGEVLWRLPPTPPCVRRGDGVGRPGAIRRPASPSAASAHSRRRSPRRFPRSRATGEDLLKGCWCPVGMRPMGSRSPQSSRRRGRSGTASERQELLCDRPRACGARTGGHVQGPQKGEINDQPVCGQVRVVSRRARSRQDGERGGRDQVDSGRRFGRRRRLSRSIVPGGAHARAGGALSRVRDSPRADAGVPGGRWGLRGARSRSPDPSWPGAAWDRWALGSIAGAAEACGDGWDRGVQPAAWVHVAAVPGHCRA